MRGEVFIAEGHGVGGLLSSVVYDPLPVLARQRAASKLLWQKKNQLPHLVSFIFLFISCMHVIVCVHLKTAYTSTYLVNILKIIFSRLL